MSGCARGTGSRPVSASLSATLRSLTTGSGREQVSGPERVGVSDRLEACLAALEDAEAAGGGGAQDVLVDGDGDDPCEV